MSCKTHLCAPSIGRRRAREASVARPEESLDVSAARIEVFGAVARAVLALDEPYKSVVMLAYYQDLSPARIGERLGRNAATVRSQLHRAHEVLRARLDGEVDGGRDVWAGLLLPFAAPSSMAPSGVGAPMQQLFSGAAVKLVVLGVVAVALFVAVPLALQGKAPGSQDAALVAEGGALLADTDSGEGALTVALQETELDGAASQSERIPIMGAGVGINAVVRDSAGPVAGATVWLTETSRLVTATEKSPLLGEQNALGLIELLGERATTDEAGRASLP